MHGHGAVHPDGYGQAEDDERMPKITAVRPSVKPASARPAPCSPVRLIWPRATWPNTIAGMVASGPNTNCASPQARLAIANPLVLVTGVATVGGATGRSDTT